MLRVFDNGDVGVRYIDYGNTARLTNGADNVRRLESHFATYPSFCCTVKLHGIVAAAASGEWSAEARSFFKEATEYKFFTMVNVVTCEVPSVTLVGSHDNKDVAQLLIGAKFAKSATASAGAPPDSAKTSAVAKPSTAATCTPDRPPQAQTPKAPLLETQPSAKVAVAGTRSVLDVLPVMEPVRFTVALGLSRGSCVGTICHAPSADVFDFDDICRCWPEQENFRPGVGTVVAVLSPEHDQWFRAYVLESQEGSLLRVFYVDYGNVEEEVRACKPIPAHFDLPYLAVRVEVQLPDGQQGSMASDTTHALRISKKDGAVAEAALQVGRKGTGIACRVLPWTALIAAAPQVTPAVAPAPAQVPAPVMASAEVAPAKAPEVPLAVSVPAKAPSVAPAKDLFEVAHAPIVPEKFPSVAPVAPAKALEVPLAVIVAPVENAANPARASTKLRFRMWPWPLNQTCTVLPVIMESLEQIFVQPLNEEAVEKLDRVLRELQSVSHASDPEQALAAGDSVVAQFPEDGVFYRARVVSIDGSAIHVHYIDYGNSAIVQPDQVRPLPQHLLDVPAVSCRLRLAGIDDLARADDVLGSAVVRQLVAGFKEVECELRVVALHEDCAEGVLSCGGLVLNDKVKELLKKDAPAVPQEAAIVEETAPAAPQEAAIVEETAPAAPQEPAIVEEAAPAAPQEPAIIEQITPASEAPRPRVRPASWTLGSDYRVLTVIASDLEHIFVQRITDKDIELLTRIELEMQSCGAAPAAGDSAPPRVGDSVAAVFADDGEFYRARVTRVDGAQIHVQFIDYGNCSVVSADQVRPLPSQLLDIEACCSRVRLSGIDPAAVVDPEPILADFKQVPCELRVVAVHVDCVEGVLSCQERVLNDLLKSVVPELVRSRATEDEPKVDNTLANCLYDDGPFLDLPTEGPFTSTILDSTVVSSIMLCSADEALLDKIRKLQVIIFFTLVHRQLFLLTQVLIDLLDTGGHGAVCERHPARLFARRQ